MRAFVVAMSAASAAVLFGAVQAATDDAAVRGLRGMEPAAGSLSDLVRYSADTASGGVTRVDEGFRTCRKYVDATRERLGKRIKAEASYP